MPTTETCGLGPITAAIIIGNTGDIDRVPTKARCALQRDRTLDATDFAGAPGGGDRTMLAVGIRA